MQLKKREKFERIEFSLRACLLNGGLPWVFWHWPCGSGDPVIWDTLLGMLCYTLLICTAVRLFRIDHVQHCTLSKQQSLVVPPSTPLLHFNNFLAAKFKFMHQACDGRGQVNRKQEKCLLCKGVGHLGFGSQRCPACDGARQVKCTAFPPARLPQTSIFYFIFHYHSFLFSSPCC